MAFKLVKSISELRELHSQLTDRMLICDPLDVCRICCHWTLIPGMNDRGSSEKMSEYNYRSCKLRMIWEYVADSHSCEKWSKL